MVPCLRMLLPVLIDFFQKHLLIAPKTFLGDAAFDTIEIYKALFGEIGFEKAFIPLRVKLSMKDNGYTINENGVPCCPHDPSLPMKREGSKSHLKSKIPTMKFVCPKMKWEYDKADKTKRRVCHCDNPCTTSSCGRMIYIYPEKNLRAYPGVERGAHAVIGIGDHRRMEWTGKSIPVLFLPAGPVACPVIGAG